MFGLGGQELIVILLVALLIFGAKRIPEIAQGLGKGVTEFKKAMKDVQDEIDPKKMLEDTEPKDEKKPVG